MVFLMNIIKSIASVISEDIDNIYNFQSVVAIVESNKGSWLLGLANSNDDRKNKWCFPGGGINTNETINQAAEREVYEETGIKCVSTKYFIVLQDKPYVVFVYCRANENQTFKPNHEFKELKFISSSELQHFDLYKNVVQIMNKFK